MQTEAEAFLQRIRAYPDDDTPRLMFADWLEEQGERVPGAADRARFIRVQVALVRLAEEEAADPLRPNPGRAEREATRLALQAEERALLESHREEWEAALPRPATGREFRRGFVEKVNIGAREFLRHANELFSAGPIRHLHLLDGGSNPVAVLQAEYMDRLSALTIQATYKGEPLAVALAQASRLGGLKRLLISRNRFEDGGVVLLANSPVLANLEELDLSGNEIGEQGARVLATSPHLGRLRRLDLSANHLGPGGAEALAASERLPALHRLELGGNEIGTARLHSLARASHLLQVPALDLSNNGLTPAGLQAILTRPAGSPAAVRLEELTLTRNEHLGSDGARVLARCPDLAGLRVLRLAHCGITDDGARALAESPHLNQLVVLDVANNPIGDAGCRGFNETTHMRSLRQLSIPGSGVSQLMRQRLKSKFRW
jgi:uncharacterized protein (TIGR02996 family)